MKIGPHVMGSNVQDLKSQDLLVRAQGSGQRRWFKATWRIAGVAVFPKTCPMALKQGGGQRVPSMVEGFIHRLAQGLPRVDRSIAKKGHVWFNCLETLLKKSFIVFRRRGCGQELNEIVRQLVQVFLAQLTIP